MKTPQQINNDIPAKFSQFRPWQWKGIEEAVAHLRAGVKVVFIDAPTGSGKTLMGEAIRSIVNPHDSSPYVCTTKSLQAQIQDDFPYAKILKGRANYPTRYHPEDYPIESCDDCDTQRIHIEPSTPPEWLKADLKEYGLLRLTSTDKDGNLWANRCDLCGVQPMCTYIQARDEALYAPLCVTNTAYYLREANGPGRTSNRRLTIVDEADEFFNTVLDTFTVQVPRYLLHRMPRPETQKPEDIGPWIEKMLNWLRIEYSTWERDKRAKVAEIGAKKYRRRMNGLSQLIQNLSIAGEDDGLWVYEGPSKRSRKDYKVATLRPVWAGEWIHDYVWAHADQWVLMSASFVSCDLEAQHLQLEPDDYAVVKIDYAFEPERKPVRFWPSAKPYTSKEERAGFNTAHDAAKKIYKILGWYPDERVLVHTVSHQRTKDIARALRAITDRTIIDFDGGGSDLREERIAAYRATEGAVLVSAGLERGYDFKYDDCRVCIIAKTPFPYFGDPVVTARVHGHGPVGQAWADMTTARAATQMVGRGMRAEDDWLVTYILDAAFRPFLKGYKSKYLPTHMLNSVVFGLPLHPEPIAMEMRSA
jgi:Rad3-related DNA helicase